MPKIEDLLPASAFQQETAYIFDHGKMEGDSLKYQDALTTYGWNMRRYNKVEVGAPVLNRRPGKITRSRKFEIFGGGFIESIGEPDADGNVVAKISHPFEFVKPIRQGDADLENMVWTSKTKKPGSWEHFWNQYGMNRISMQDFKTLVQGRNCMSVEEGHATLPQIEDAQDVTAIHEVRKIDIHVFDDPSAESEKEDPKPLLMHGTPDALIQVNQKKALSVPKPRKCGVKVDFKAIQAERDKVGALGELIVFEYWQNKTELYNRQHQQKKLPIPVHVSQTEGDGLGYDIRAWDEDRTELHIEVKTTKTRYPDGFDMSRNELEVARADGDCYWIYRVYNLDVINKTCDIRIYKGPFSSEHYRFAPTMYKVYCK